MSIFTTIAAMTLVTSSQNQQVIIAQDYDPISTEEIRQRINICLDYKAGKIPGQNIVRVFNLDTPRKRRDFELTCSVILESAKAGYDMSVQDFRKKGV